jgi:hypothetical protein
MRRSLAFNARGVFTIAIISLPLRAQSGRLDGTIVDSVHARPLAGASVLAIRVDSGAAHSSGATTDARGRYRVDSLPAGRYMVEFASAFLDSLEIALPPRELTIQSGRTTRADFALPSGRTLRAAACPSVALPPGTGAMMGQVLEADNEAPLVDARVVVAWRELSVDPATLQVTAADRTGAVSTDSLGRYRLCGVATDEWMVLQVQHAGRAGSDIRAFVPDSAGVLVRHLSLSAGASRPLVAEGRVADTTPLPPLTGTATVAGVVRGVGGLPLGEAQVQVLGARGTSVTDARGGFSLGDLPSGTQVLEVRRMGYLLGQQPVELRAGQTLTEDVRLRRIVTLDSIRVLAQRSRYRQFEDHRKTNPFGTFLTAGDIEGRRPFYTSDLFRQIPGFTVSGSGFEAVVGPGRGVASLTGACTTNVVIDGMPNQEVNLINPNNIGAMEVYRPGQPGPIEYNKGCGVIMIWSKR